jgi:hypothetical protein
MEETFASYSSDKGLHSNSKRTNNPANKRADEVNRPFSGEEAEMADK